MPVTAEHMTPLHGVTSHVPDMGGKGGSGYVYAEESRAIPQRDPEVEGSVAAEQTTAEVDAAVSALPPFIVGVVSSRDTFNIGDNILIQFYVNSGTEKVTEIFLDANRMHTGNIGPITGPVLQFASYLKVSSVQLSNNFSVTPTTTHFATDMFVGNGMGRMPQTNSLHFNASAKTPVAGVQHLFNVVLEVLPVDRSTETSNCREAPIVIGGGMFVVTDARGGTNFWKTVFKKGEFMVIDGDERDDGYKIHLNFSDKFPRRVQEVVQRRANIAAHATEPPPQSTVPAPPPPPPPDTDIPIEPQTPMAEPPTRTPPTTEPPTYNSPPTTEPPTYNAPPTTEPPTYFVNSIHGGDGPIIGGMTLVASGVASLAFINFTLPNAAISAAAIVWGGAMLLQAL
jgi:hypothetical protein